MNQPIRKGDPGIRAGRNDRFCAVRKRDIQRGVLFRIKVDDLFRRRRRSLGAAQPPSRKPVRVFISNTESEFYTLVDVIADDRIGLLYDVTRCIGEQNHEIYISKAATIKDQVTDSFYLKDSSGRKIRDTEALDRLRRALLVAAALPSDQDDASPGARR